MKMPEDLHGKVILFPMMALSSTQSPFTLVGFYLFLVSIHMLKLIEYS